MGQHWATDVFESYSNNGAHYVAWGWNHFDSRTNRYARHVTDTLGGSARYSSSGWEGDTWESVGAAAGPLHPAVDVVQTVTSKHAEHFWITARWLDREQTRHDLYKADCFRKNTQQRVAE